MQRTNQTPFGKLRLFRGDASKIKEFHLAQTNRYCLLGQGVYLTDREVVADSYRIKGDLGAIGPLKVTFYAKDRTESKELGLEKFLNHKRILLRQWPTKLTLKEIDQYTKEYHDRLRDESLLLVRGNQEVQSGTANKKWSFTLSEVGGKSGWVSVFEFPEPYFSCNLINIDAPRKDKGFLELLDDPKFWKDKGNTIKSTSGELTGYQGYLKQRDGFTKDWVRLDPRELHFSKLVPVLKEFGIHGFEYNGGARLGGGFYHRAFNIFDQDYVNDHKVDRYR